MLHLSWFGAMAFHGQSQAQAVGNRAVHCVQRDSPCLLQELNSYWWLLKVSSAAVPHPLLCPRGQGPCSVSHLGTALSAERANCSHLHFARDLGGGRQSAFLGIILLEFEDLNTSLVSHALNVWVHNVSVFLLSLMLIKCPVINNWIFLWVSFSFFSIVLSGQMKQWLKNSINYDLGYSHFLCLQVATFLFFNEPLS